MIVRKLEEVTNTLLHDAILIATLQGNNFNRVYIDNEGGCNIKFSNKMNIDSIKLFLVNLNPHLIIISFIPCFILYIVIFTDNNISFTCIVLTILYILL